MESLQDMVMEDKEIAESLKQTSEINIDADENIHQLTSESCPVSLTLRICSFENSSEMNKFIKAVEKLVRSSIEYKHWKNYLIDILGCVECDITGELLNEVSIEVHHHIPSLYDVVKAVVCKNLEDQKEFCTFDIATKVIEIHYQNKIGFVMLVKTLHEKFHNGFLKIPIDLVRGNYLAFLNEYSRYLDDEDLDKINERLAITESNCLWSREVYPENQEAAEG